MNDRKIKIVSTEDGILTDNQVAPKPQSNTNLYPLHDTQPYCYEDPTEPVALEDWQN